MSHPRWNPGLLNYGVPPMGNSIRIKNLYYMLSYAYRLMNETDKNHVAAEDFEHIHDLFAAILVQGAGSQLKRGLHRDYVLQEDALSGLRGQIRMSESIKRQSLTRKKLVCIFDEFSVDNHHNQIIKCTLMLLLQRGTVREKNKKNMRKLLLYFGEVSHIEPWTIRWDTLRYQRNSISYKTLLELCRLVIKGMLITTETGNYRLSGWLQDEEMYKLYERFVLAYYKCHHPELSPQAAQINWNLAEPADRTFLPSMQSDITLKNRDKTLIIDTKYYSASMHAASAYNKASYISGHLYQIFSYVKNCDKEMTGNVSGVLLYAKTNEANTPDSDYVMGGNLISLKTLDLDSDWEKITERLEALCLWLTKGCIS